MKIKVDSLWGRAHIAQKEKSLISKCNKAVLRQADDESGTVNVRCPQQGLMGKKRVNGVGSLRNPSYVPWLCMLCLLGLFTDAFLYTSPAFFFFHLSISFIFLSTLLAYRVSDPGANEREGQNYPRATGLAVSKEGGREAVLSVLQAFNHLHQGFWSKASSHQGRP